MTQEVSVPHINSKKIVTFRVTIFFLLLFAHFSRFVMLHQHASKIMNDIMLTMGHGFIRFFA